MGQTIIRTGGGGGQPGPRKQCFLTAVLMLHIGNDITYAVPLRNRQGGLQLGVVWVCPASLESHSGYVTPLPLHVSMLEQSGKSSPLVQAHSPYFKVPFINGKADLLYKGVRDHPSLRLPPLSLCLVNVCAGTED